MRSELQPLKGSFGGGVGGGRSLGRANWEFVRHDWWISSHGRFKCSPIGTRGELKYGEECGKLLRHRGKARAEILAAKRAFSFVRGAILIDILVRSHLREREVLSNVSRGPPPLTSILHIKEPE